MNRVLELFGSWNGFCFPASMILPFLFLGNASSSLDFQWLEKSKITGILCCAKELGYRELYSSNMKYLKLELEDSSEFELTLSVFEMANAFIEQIRNESGRVLVHCAGGVSRSATVVLAYLMLKHNLDMCTALAWVKEKRSVIFPNQGFFKKLACLEQCCWIDHLAYIYSAMYMVMDARNEFSKLLKTK